MIGVFGCKNEVKNNTIDPPKNKDEQIFNKKTQQKPLVKEEKTFITQENVTSFLMDYGKKNPEKLCVIETKFGEIEIELFENTPLHRANFIYLVKNEYFNTTYFHRVVKDFIIQGGNSDETKTQKSRNALGDYLIPSELNKNSHHYGAIAAAREWIDNPNKLSNPFEFYIIQNKAGSYHLDGEHTVFGHVTKGMNVVDEIAKQPIDAGEYPLLNVKMKIRLK
jgi:peptidylprolyl isomerase